MSDTCPSMVVSWDSRNSIWRFWLRTLGLSKYWSKVRMEPTATAANSTARARNQRT